MANRNGRTLTPEQQAKSEARRAQFKELARRIAAMSADEQRVMAEKMAGAVTIEGHALSMHNACLLACQCPNATLVGGFNQWRQHGRMVRKGEHGLMIWAPARRPEDPNKREGEVSSADERPNFIMVTVFDVTQTDEVA